MSIDTVVTELKIGSYDVNRVPEFRILSDRYAPVSLCYLTLPDADGELYNSFAAGSAVSLTYGYKAGEQAEWSGTVTYISRAGDNIFVTAADAARSVLTTKVVEYWAGDSAAAIVRSALSRVGSIGTVQDDGITLESFTASNISVYELVRKVEHTLQCSAGKDMSQYALFMSSGAWHWGQHGISGTVPVIASQAGLIAHIPGAEGFGSKQPVETWMLPGFTHSRTFRLTDKTIGIDADYMADKVMHVFRDKYVRTFIEYGGGNGKY